MMISYEWIDDNEKAVIVKEYMTQIGIEYTSGSVPVQKSWSLSCLNNQGNIESSIELIYIQPSKPEAIYN